MNESEFFDVYLFGDFNRNIGSASFELHEEMSSAILKHGIEQTPANPEMDIHQKMTILTEEVGEVARACTYDEGSRENRIEELIQVAAMALMWCVAEKSL